MSAKTLNYVKLTSVEQEKKEVPGKFLYRLREALHKFTEIDPESEEGRMILNIDFSLSQLQISTISYTKSVFRYSVTTGSDSILW